MKHPNILLLMTDQHRWDCVGCTGNPAIETPNLDWLASQGTVFTHAYSACPSCVPARAMLITGMKPWNTGILGTGRGHEDMGVGFEHTLAGEFAAAGYHTQGVGKMHFFPQRSLNGFHGTVLDESSRVEDPGFISDYVQWFDANKDGNYGIADHGVDWNSWMARPFHAPEWLHQTNWTANESIRFLKQRDPTRPFFLMASFSRPHSPYTPPAYYYDLYRDRELPEPYIGEWSVVNDVPADAAAPDAWRGRRSPEETRRARAAYYGSVTHIDHQIGRILMWLRNAGLLDDTAVLFTADHGDMLGDHNLWRKTHAYEGSAHIPFIVRLPHGMGAPSARRAAHPVGLQDVMPTLLDAAGLGIPGSVDGRSVLPLMRGEGTRWRDCLHGEHNTEPAHPNDMQYVTDGRFKYVWFPQTGGEQLFDLNRDPGECRDLSGDGAYVQELETWRQHLVRELETRNLGLTDGGRLVCRQGRPPIVSPAYDERKKRNGVDWGNSAPADP